MKVGDYARTKTQGIKRILDIGSFMGIKQYKIDEEGKYTIDSSIIKSSPNIIDLIEVGDVLIVKEYCDEVCQIFTEIYLIQSDDQLLNIKEDLEKNKNHKLYSILTKEMFEQMEYKIQ